MTWDMVCDRAAADYLGWSLEGYLGLREARAVGATFTTKDDSLVIKLPPGAEHLLPSLRELRPQLEKLWRTGPEARYWVRYGQDMPPWRPCPWCGNKLYWRRPYGGFVCATCHPSPRTGPAPEPKAPERRSYLAGVLMKRWKQLGVKIRVKAAIGN